MDRDALYLDILLNRLAVCRTYRPKFGMGQKTSGLSLTDFKRLYSADPFYAWFGLDNPLLYAAHRAAGGITSVYRQLGLGVEELCRRIMQDQLGLADEQVNWAYTVRTDGRSRRLSLDARIAYDDVAAPSQRETVKNWLREAAARLDVESEVAQVLRGAVFEIRQGYKSKDSKRQNADIANAAAAYAQGYLPVVMVLSLQIDNAIAERYENEKWLVLRGISQGAATLSTYTFFQAVIGYDLAAFFARHSDVLQSTITDILTILLSGDEGNGDAAR